MDYLYQPPNPQIVLPCLFKAQTTSIAVTVFLLACSVQVTASLTIPSRNPLRTCLESSQMNDEILLTPPLRANLLMAGLVIPSIEALACLLVAVLLVPTFPFPPTPLPPFPCPAIKLNVMNIAVPQIYRAGYRSLIKLKFDWLIIIMMDLNSNILSYQKFILQKQISNIRSLDFIFCIILKISSLLSLFKKLIFYQIKRVYNKSLQMKKALTCIFITVVFLIALGECRADKKMNKKQKTTNRRASKHHQQQSPHYLTPDKPQFWYNCVLATFLALAGGFCSGMTVGLNSLSTLNLQIMQKSSNQKDKQMAQRILGVIKDHHLFLVTLLVGNALVLQSLPLVIHLIMPDWAAILFSTVIVLIVAEVVPMSYSTGSYKYIIAYYGAPLVSLMIKVFWPVCYPIARGLDMLLKKQHEERIQRRDFLTFINDKHRNFLDKLEIEFINRVMNHQNRTINQIMIPLDKLLLIQEKQEIDQNFVQKISESEFTFVLVYRKTRGNIFAYVKICDIILKYLALPPQQTNLNIKKLNLRTKLYTIYNDAITIEALQIHEQFKTMILLVCQQKKHQLRRKSTGLSMVSVYQAKQWVADKNEKTIGVITLNQVLHQIADYPTTTLKAIQRKLSIQIGSDAQT